MPYTLTDALHSVATSPEGYLAVHGKLTFDTTRLPVTDWENQGATPALTRIPARIKGKSLTRKGFKNRFNRKITLELHCAGPWCASARSGKTALTFLKQTDQGYTLTIAPCAANAFFDPDRAALEQTKDCYLNGNCPKSARP